LSAAVDVALAEVDPWSALPLSPQHAAMLRASAISPEVAARRGYRTVWTKDELAAARFADSQRQVPTLLIPVCDATGEVVLHQHRPDHPRRRKGKPLKYETPAGARMAIDVPPALDRVTLNDPAVPLIVTEGVKKADAAVSVGLACVALLGVWNWRGKNAQGGVATLADWDTIVLKGRHVYVCFDSDVTTKPEVAQALSRLRAFLVARKARVRIVYLPAASNGGKQGLDDFLAAGGTAEQIAALAEDDVREDHGGDDRPEIIITTEEHDVTDAAVAALVREPGLYHRGGRLVRVRCDPRNAMPPAIEPMPLATIRELLTKNARLVRLRERSVDGASVAVKTAAHPPDFLVRAIDARAAWPGTRYLVGVTEHPTPRPDGSVLDVAGYDDATGLLYIPSADYPKVPERPTRDDAVAAMRELLDVVSDFPFATEAHRSAWVALLLTALARDAIAGPVPLGAIDATTPGTGKTLLADAVMQIAAGRPATRTAMPDSEEELRKRITSHVMAGDRAVLFDNIARPLGGAALDAVLTGTTWSDRILGRSETTRDLPLATLWLATGNNLEFRGDLIRRVLHVRLDAGQERPEERTGFRHPHLLRWLRAERPRLVVAALTVLRAYSRAGRRDHRLRSWGSFEAWSELIRGAIVWSGLPDPAATREGLNSAGDARREAHAELLAGWDELDVHGVGLTTAEAIRRLDDPGNRTRFDMLRSAISQLTYLPIGKLPSAAKLGSTLRGVRGRIVNGLRLDEAGKRHNAAVWRVSKVDSGEIREDGEHREDASSPSRDEGDRFDTAGAVQRNLSWTRPPGWSPSSSSSHGADDEVLL
jgi:hypothetical protein